MTTARREFWDYPPTRQPRVEVLPPEPEVRVRYLARRRRTPWLRYALAALCGFLLLRFWFPVALITTLVGMSVYEHLAVLAVAIAIVLPLLIFAAIRERRGRPGSSSK